MKTFYISLSLSLLSIVGSSQISVCDSIFIDSCQFGPNVNTEIRLLASNHSNDIISYPGFILFNNNGDTIAKENVNFFGIGWGFQPHILQIINPPTLPLNGYVELHSGFYDSLRCVFPITLADTLTSIKKADKIEALLSPNPAVDHFNIKFTNPFNGSLRIMNSIGQMILSETIINKNSHEIKLPENIVKGMYLVELLNENYKHKKIIKLMIE